MTYEQKIETCKACDKYIKLTAMCSVCGCFMKLKAKFDGNTCPEGKHE